MHVTLEMYCKIQEMRAAGRYQWQAAEDLGYARSTIARYWKMPIERFQSLPRKTAKSILGRYRQTIIDLLEEDPNFSNNEIFEFLTEKYIDFSISKRETIEYLYELRREENFPYGERKRQYQRREETLPGEESQVDMGQIALHDLYGHRIKIYIFAMVLSCSRMRFFTLRLTPFDSLAFIEAHKLAFKFFGGRTKYIMYDQDRVMVVSENAGSIVFTKPFQEFKSQIGFNVFLCHKQDPNTKGKIENTIKYIKYNFFKSKQYTNLETLNSEAQIWLDTVANAKVHGATLKIPNEEFAEEKKSLIEIPKLEEIEIKYRTAKVDKLNTITYLTNYYSVPLGRYKCGDMVKLACVNGLVKIYDTETDELVAQHLQLESRGQTSIIPEKRWAYDGLIAETLNVLRNSDIASDFIEHIKQEMPRYIRQQCNMLKKIAKEYSATQIDSALMWCIERNLYSATDVLAVLVSEGGFDKAKSIMPAKSGEYYKKKAKALSAYDSLVKNKEEYDYE